jgi:hypothetical protein
MHTAKTGFNYLSPDSPPDSARHRHQAPKMPLPQRSLLARRLKLEQDPAFEYVPENRSGMAMRRQPASAGGSSTSCVIACAPSGIEGGVMHSRSVTLMFPATNTSPTLTPIQPLPWATFAPRTGASST